MKAKKTIRRPRHHKEGELPVEVKGLLCEKAKRFGQPQPVALRRRHHFRHQPHPCRRGGSSFGGCCAAIAAAAAPAASAATAAAAAARSASWRLVKTPPKSSASPSRSTAAPATPSATPMATKLCATWGAGIEKEKRVKMKKKCVQRRQTPHA